MDPGDMSETYDHATIVGSCAGGKWIPQDGVPNSLILVHENAQQFLGEIPERDLTTIYEGTSRRE